MTDSTPGPFKRISMPWFPFSVPATFLAAVALSILHGVFALVALVSKEIESASQAEAIFLAQLESVTTSLSLLPGLPGGRWPFFVGAVSVLLVWAFFGVAICRCLALRLTRDEYLGVKDALGFARAKFGTAILFPVIVVGCILLLGLVNGLLGLLMQIPYLGLVFQILVPLAYLLTALMLAIFFSALFGGGMVAGAIAVEARGTLDAWGKALNYTFARPLHIIVYVVLLKVLLFDFLIGFGLGRGLLHRWTRASLSPLWTNSGFENALDGHGEGIYADLMAKAWDLFSGLASLGLGAVVLSFALGGFTSMFLILRKDVDGIDTSEIELPGSTDPEPIPA